MLFWGWLSGTITAMLANADAVRSAYTKRTESMQLFLKVLILYIKNTYFCCINFLQNLFNLHNFLFYEEPQYNWAFI